MGVLDLIRRRERADGSEHLYVERPEYYVQTGSMFENPHGVPHDEIVRMILENPPETSAQTVFGKYVESSGLVFKAEAIEMLFQRELDIIRGNSWIDGQLWRNIAEPTGRRLNWWGDFYTGVDFARQTDYTVLFTIYTRQLPARVVYYKRLNRVPWESIYAEVGRARHLWGPNILCDGTGPGGDVVMDALESRLYCPEHHKTVMVGSRCMRNGEDLDCKPKDYLALSCCEPFQFSGPSKKELVEHLRNQMEAGYDAASGGKEPFGRLRCPSIPQLEEELTFYAWDDKGLDTDCLMAIALAAWAGLEDPVQEASVGSVYGR